MKFTGERLIPDIECTRNKFLYKEHIMRYKFASRFIEDKTILDIACGTGYGTNIMVNNGKPKFIVGADKSEEAIIYALNRYVGKNTDFKKIEAPILDLQNEYFDCIVSFETLEHITDQKKMIMEFYRVLKKGGFLILSTPNKKVTAWNNPFHVKELTWQELEEMLKPYFHSFQWFGQKTIEHFPSWAAKLHIRRFLKIYRQYINYSKPIPLYSKNENIIGTIVVICTK